ncbi:hypothetical protein [Streptomyces collinus]|uniref:hypothetical protein n=1 Tax=Streptomyces collinus TaxID=42684 RepID=UPI0036E3B6A7
MRRAGDRGAAAAPGRRTGLVLGVRASHVDRASGPGLGLVAMVAGLLVAGASGHLLLRGDAVAGAGAGGRAGGAARSTG